MITAEPIKLSETECESDFLCMKKCNACTCIHNVNGYCSSFKGSECEIYEMQLIQEN